MIFYQCDNCFELTPRDELSSKRQNLTYEYGVEGPPVYINILACPHCGCDSITEYQDYEVEEIVEQYIEDSSDISFDRLCTLNKFDKFQREYAAHLIEIA